MSYRSLIEEYEGLVNRSFIGRCFGIRRGENIKADFAVFKIDKLQPFPQSKTFLREMLHLYWYSNVSD